MEKTIIEANDYFTGQYLVTSKSYQFFVATSNKKMVIIIIWVSLLLTKMVL